MLGRLFILATLVAPLCLQAQAAPSSLYILSYHDIRETVTEAPDPTTVTTGHLIQHFDWLHDQGYHVIDVDTLLRADRGEVKLPEKTVMLSFDDCYQSHYTHVFPLLRAYGYPAVMACVGSWLDVPQGGIVNYGDAKRARADFLGLDEMREMAASGLVEFASHSYDLHRGIPANPQGNTEPAATTSAYATKEGHYESLDHYLTRIEQDLARSKQFFMRALGRAPRVIAWPYGEYNAITMRSARQQGMRIMLTLDDHGGPTPLRLDRLGRELILNNPKAQDLAWQLRFTIRAPIRAVQVDLDYVHDPDPKAQEHNLDLLVERISRIGANTVYLQAFADPDGDGNADALYFPNRHLPMRADLMNRVAWQLRTRADVKVFGWLPVLAYTFPPNHPAARDWVEARDGARGPAAGMRRLSPFSPRVRQAIGDIYEDMARMAPLQGVLFHDDALLGDNEDVSPWALQTYAKYGLSSDPQRLQHDPALTDKWRAYQTRYLIDFTTELSQRMRVYRPFLQTARNLFAQPVLNPAAEAWYAQSLPAFLGAYDQVALMAMPDMEQAKNPDKWLRGLAARVRATPGALDRTVFELQARNWRNGRMIHDATLARQMQLLQQESVRNIGYYPDDFIRGLPAEQMLRMHFSIRPQPN